MNESIVKDKCTSSSSDTSLKTEKNNVNKQ